MSGNSANRPLNVDILKGVLSRGAVSIARNKMCFAFYSKKQQQMSENRGTRESQ